jgi:GTP cyclohydrolase I
MTIDRPAAERAIHDFLCALGHPPEQSAELEDTPRRVAEAYAGELLAGYGVDIARLLSSGSPAQDSGLVVMRGAFVTTMCPHHLLPSMGTATLAYVPGERVFGLGVLAELLDACSRRLVLQEQIGHSVVHALMDHGAARGAFCGLEMVHACLAARGAKRPEAKIFTSARAGDLPEPEIAALLMPSETP